MTSAGLLALAVLSASQPVEPPPVGVAGLRLTDVSGAIHVLGRDDGARPFAVVFMSTDCPISNRYVPRLNTLAIEARSLGVEFFGVISDPAIDRQQARQHAHEYAVTFPVLFDASGTLARRLKPEHVPEAFVVARNDRLVYRGRISNLFAALGTPRRRATTNELGDALAAVAGGKPVAKPRTETVGCIFEAWSDGGDAPKDVTYHRHVAPIINANCVECHRPGAVGPFPLETYAQVKRHAKMIAQVCGQGLMPPWRAKPGHGSFLNERRLDDRQLAVLQQWASSGAKVGRNEDTTPKPVLKAVGWELGEPDLVLEMPAPYEVPADGVDIYRCFVLPTRLGEDQMLVGHQFQPGAPAVVHHAVLWLDTTGKARAADAKDPGPGYTAYFDSAGPGFETTYPIAVWTPGMGARSLPASFGQEIKKGGDIVLEIHYHQNGKATSDQSRFALYFAKRPVRQIGALFIGTYDIRIPAGENDYRRHAWMELPSDVTLVDCLPHMHFLGKSFKVDATLPDGAVVPLIDIPKWDFRWQDYYVYADPVKLPKGTRIDVRMSYDNSSANLANVHQPPIPVKWGWSSEDEMGDVTFTVIPTGKGLLELLRLEATSYDSFLRLGDGSKNRLPKDRYPKGASGR